MNKKGILFLLYSIVNYIERLIKFKVSNNTSEAIYFVETVKRRLKTCSRFL